MELNSLLTGEIADCLLMKTYLRQGNRLLLEEQYVLRCIQVGT